MFILIGLVISAIIIGFISKSLAEEKPRVTIVLKDMNSQYWEIVKAGAEKGFRDFNVNGKVVAPLEGTTEEQLQVLERVLKEKPDVLIVSPTLPSEIIPFLDEFVENNIPTLLLDTDDPWENKTSYIGTDNLELGKRAGGLLASQLQPGDKVAIIAGDKRVIVIGERVEGAKISLKAAGINVVAEKLKITNDEKPVREAVEEILQEHPDVKGIIATTDLVAIHATKALLERGYKIPVTGADGITEMLELIEGGTLTGTVAQNPYDMGYLSVEAALKAATGEQVEKNIDSGVDIIIKGNAEERLDFLNDLLN